MKIVRNYIEPKLTVLVFGATGLVGKELISILEKDDRYGRITIANRRKISYTNDCIKEIMVDFKQLQNIENYFKVDHVFICLGSTIKKAGSQEQFVKIDLQYPTEIAMMAKKNGVSSLVHISALGANKESSNFYLNIKGRVEEEIENFGPRYSFSVRPSLLLGQREEKRVAEGFGQFFATKLGFLMIGGLKQYRAIKARDVASAMVEIANKKPEQKHILSEDLKVISRYNSM